MVASEEALRQAYSDWLAGVLMNTHTPTASEYLLWREYDDRLALGLGAAHLADILDDAVNRIAVQRLTINRVRHILDSGYGCTACALGDLRQAVGLDPSPIPHEEHL